jgi:peptidoglycan/xylan/chitin deacetylase (PgdA/CDA1 family)
MRPAVSRRRSAPLRWLAASAGGVAVLAGALWTAPRWLVPRLAARSPRCLHAVRTRERVVALTLDDGPDAAHTPAILRLLHAHGARATFFLISGRVPGREALVAAAVAAGHELGNHLTRDEPSIRLPPDAFAAALREAGTVLGRFGPVRWVRPGSGWYTRAMLDAIEREGCRCALGSVYPYDAHVPSARLAAAYVLANARPGAVIVLHEGGGRGRRTIAVLQRVLPALRARGYRVVTLSELEAIGNRQSALGHGVPSYATCNVLRRSPRAESPQPRATRRGERAMEPGPAALHLH